MLPPACGQWWVLAAASLPSLRPRTRPRPRPMLPASILVLNRRPISFRAGVLAFQYFIYVFDCRCTDVTINQKKFQAWSCTLCITFAFAFYTKCLYLENCPKGLRRPFSVQSLYLMYYLALLFQINATKSPTSEKKIVTSVSVQWMMSGIVEFSYLLLFLYLCTTYIQDGSYIDWNHRSIFLKVTLHSLSLAWIDILDICKNWRKLDQIK